MNALPATNVRRKSWLSIFERHSRFEPEIVLPAQWLSADPIADPGIRRLANAMILDAIASLGREAHEAQEAALWLFYEGRGALPFDWCCALAGAVPEEIRKVARRRFRWIDAFITDRDFAPAARTALQSAIEGGTFHG